jgi:pheromone shutdown protein TraB
MIKKEKNDKSDLKEIMNDYERANSVFKKKDKNSMPVLKYLSITVQLGFIIVFSIILTLGLAIKLHQCYNEDWILLVGIFLGVSSGFYMGYKFIVKTFNLKLTNKNKEKSKK